MICTTNNKQVSSFALSQKFGKTEIRIFAKC